MMVSPSGIAISLGSSHGSDSRPVVARIFGFATADQESPITRELVVPPGGSEKQDLPQGLYNVQLTLPSGRILQRNVRIAEDSHETYRFFEDFVAGRGFSLQESAGRGEGDDLLAKAAQASGNTSAPDYQSAVDAAVNRYRPETSVQRGVRRGFDFAPANSIPVDSARVPKPPQGATLTMFSGLPIPLAALEPPTISGSEVAPADQRGDSALWRLEYNGVEPPSPQSRKWARITLPDGRVELASIPLPWLCTGSAMFSAAEVLVDPARGDGAATTVAMRDERLGGLLAYLDRGQAGAARALLEQLERDDVIEQAIREKGSNPLAACAAAYVGLAVYDPREREVWDHWLGRCMSLFPGVPDAAIVHARRLFLRPTGREDNTAAADALRLACTAGVPFFSAGVVLLREMLAMLSVDYPDLAPLAEDAGRLASRVDPSQAFTVIRYAAPRETKR